MLLPCSTKFEVNPVTHLLASEALNTVASSVLLVAIPLIAITAFDANAMEVAALAAAGTAPPLLFGLSAGALADRLDRRRLAIACGVARLSSLFTLSFLFFFNLVNLTILCFVSFAVSAVRVLFDCIVAAVIPTIVPKSYLTKANSWFEGANAAASALGPALAGWVLQAMSATAACAVTSILYLVSTLLIRKTTLPSITRAEKKTQSHFLDIAEGVMLLWTNKIQLTIALAAALFNLFHTAFLTVFTLYAVKELSFSAATFGTVLSVVGLAGLLGAACAPRLIALVGVRTSLVGSLLIIGPIGVPILFVTELSFIQRAVIVAVCLAAWDFFIVVHLIVEQTLRQVTVENEHMSRITATTRFVSWGADPIGAVLGGIAASSVLGNSATLGLCLIGFVVAGSLLLTSQRIRRLESGDLLSND